MRELYLKLLLSSLSLLLLLLPAPHIADAFSYDFSGTVLYDSRASNSVCPGFGDAFTGTLELNDKLVFVNGRAETTYEDFGTVSGGNFSQDGQDLFYALSRGSSDHSQMGMIWWSKPKSFRIGQNDFNNIYGLTFYLDGSLLYTPAQLVAMRLSDYLEDGYLPTFTGGSSVLHYTGCSLASGIAFLGIIETPYINRTGDAADGPAAVPLPASFWFLGIGLLSFLRYRKT